LVYSNFSKVRQIKTHVADFEKKPTFTWLFSK
jgi:hypothetical protein